jgi:hypothetical protein
VKQKGKLMENLGTFLFWLAVAMAVALTIAVVGLALMWRRIKALNVPRTAGFFGTMHYIPLPLVILLDLLDFGLDIFAAPVSWLVLDRLGLMGLRNKAALEALIPFTQPIPTFTLGWIAARTLHLGDDELTHMIEGEVVKRNV